MRPDSYREQDGCPHCAHVFRYDEYDEEPIYFCHVDGSKRPRCGSGAMDESQPWNKMLSAAWCMWSTPRAVRSLGVCDLFERRREV
jgi:hypothetical protein